MANNEEKNKKSKKAKPRKVKAKTKSKNSGKETALKKKNKKEKFSKRHPKLVLFIKIIIIIILLLCVVGAGVIAGLFFGLFGDDFEISKSDLQIGASNSVIVDAQGNVIANLSGDEKRKIITLDEMADYLPKAYVAIEDERFYQHSGVDIKRTAGAIFYKLIGKSSYGGSSITQQLVKNITKDDETSGIEGIMRKVKEWAKAYQVERMISKDQILELYLNILFVGSSNLHGVELGAEYYFNKSAQELDLAECAFMAGINSSPNYYNPYELMLDGDTTEKRDERIRKKTLTVLAKMKELGYIENEEEYNAAVAKVEAGLTFENGVSTTATTYSDHTDALINQVVEQVMEEKDISRQLAENYVYSSGLTIYSTVDTSIQSRLEEEVEKSRYQITSPSGKQTSQSGTAIIDYKTGNVVAISGGLGEKDEWNRATQMKKQTGSSMKPIAVIAPGLEEKIITASTVYYDYATDFSGYTPKNYNAFQGPVNIRSFIRTSQNIPAVKIMAELTPSKSIDYLRKMGLKSLYKNGDSTIYNDESLPLAIGGLSEGASPLEMAAAYGTIANDGVYITPTFYSKVVDSSGNVVMTPNQEQTRVISAQNAYITKSILQEPVKSGGTATYCAISGMDVAAKTGTTDDTKDRWLCGFTPYYAAATWFGYDDSETVYYSGSSTNPAGDIWDAVMTDIHKGLASATFTKPDGIVEATVCKDTGCLASSACTNTYVEIFTSDNMPARCEGHQTQVLCTESKKLANEYCPETENNVYGYVLPKEQTKLWTTTGGTTSGKGITEVCDIHKAPEETTNTTNTNENTTNATTNIINNTTNTTTNTNTSVNTNSVNKTNTTNTINTTNTTNTINKTNTTNTTNTSNTVNTTNTGT